MRTAGLLVVISLIISVFSPVTINFDIDGKKRVFVALDVCNAGGSSLTVNGDVKALCIDMYDIPAPRLNSPVEIVESFLKPIMIPFKKERPPRV